MGKEIPYGIGSDVWPGLGKTLEELGELGEILGKIIGSGGTLDHKWVCKECGGTGQVILTRWDNDHYSTVCWICKGSGYMGSGDLTDALHDELADVLAAITFLMDVNNEIDTERITIRSEEKLARFKKWRASGVF